MSSEPGTNRLRAFRIVPLWIPYAPGPLRSAQRSRLLQGSIAWLRGRQTAGKPIEWNLIDLIARQQPESVSDPACWSPREIAARKQKMLIGSYRGDGEAAKAANEELIRL